METNLKVLFTTTLIGILVACGTFEQPPVHTEQDIDSRLQPYVDQFLQDCETRRADCRTKFAKITSIKVHKAFPLSDDITEDTIGLCQLSRRRNWIMIKEEVFDRFDEHVRALMYHELAHCVYELDHVPEKNKLMSTHMPDILTVVYKWDKLVNEMFAQVEQRHGN